MLLRLRSHPLKHRPGEGSSLTEIVNVDTVDHFCNQKNIEQIDILKMDVQGCGLSILRGCVRMLDSRRIKSILSGVCFHMREQTPGAQFFDELNSYFEAYEFRLAGFCDQFRWGSRRWFLGFCNALYILE